MAGRAGSDATLVDKIVRRHPLQRLESPSRTLSALFHLGGLTSFFFSFKYLADHPNPINESYGWHLQYLTIIGLALATLTFAFGLVADVTLSQRFFLLKNTFSPASAPLEVLISLLYWGLTLIDRELVVPSWLPQLPFWNDFGFHAAPALFLLVDLLLFSPPWAISAWPAFSLSVSIAVTYWLWIHECYKHNGFFPYPIFEVELPLRATIFAGSAVVMTVATLCLQWVYGQLNGSSIAHDVVKGKKRN